MPIYEYGCSHCGAQQEVFHRMSESPDVACDKCGKGPMQKLVSAAGFRLKGGGWYETDFKSDNRRNLAGGGDTSAAPASSTPASSTPAAAPAAKGGASEG